MYVYKNILHNKGCTMSSALSKAEIVGRTKDLAAKIKNGKKAIKHEFSDYKHVSSVFVGATKLYKKTKAAYDKRPNIKREIRLDSALDKFYAAHEDYKAVYNAIDAMFTDIEVDYNEMLDLYEIIGAYRKVERGQLELERYRNWLERKLAALSIGVPDLVDDEEPAEETEAEEAAPVESAPAVAAPISVNPIAIDVTNIVENAVNSVMEKLNEMLNAKLEEYFANVPAPVVTAAPVAVVPAAGESTVATVELEGELLSKEQEVYNKLMAMSAEITAMIESLDVVTDKHVQLATKHKDLNGMQKQTNDTLRHIMRDQQGIQVSLRIVNQDQAEVSAQQAAVVESQKLVVEQQQTLADTQRGMIETQSAVIETQNGLNDAMREVMQSQKDILQTQNKIAQGNAKAHEAGKVLLEKQGELTELQKAVLASHRQAMKEQKEVAEKLGVAVKPARAKRAASADDQAE